MVRAMVSRAGILMFANCWVNALMSCFSKAFGDQFAPVVMPAFMGNPNEGVSEFSQEVLWQPLRKFF